MLCGGNDGSPQDMDDHMEVTRIVKVIIRHSNAIDALSICFDHEGTSKQTSLWGGNKGELTEVPDSFTNFLWGIFRDGPNNLVLYIGTKLKF